MATVTRSVSTIAAFVDVVEEIQDEWSPVLPWFRGESGTEKYPLTPTLYRVPDGTAYDENWLLQTFRQEAPIVDLPLLPETGRIDQWMFLARHVGLPTRLLDWTEGALIALNFALRRIHPEPSRHVPPVVWILNPFKLLKLTPQEPEPLPNIYPLTWFAPQRKLITDTDIEFEKLAVYGEIRELRFPRNLGFVNFQAAWGGRDETQYPVPIRPPYVHDRMMAQLSCFTIYGEDHQALDQMLKDHNCLIKIIIEMDRVESLRQLRTLGITHVNVMPDADGLAADIEQRYPPK